MVADGEFGLTAIVNAVSTLTGVVVPVETSFTKIVVGIARLPLVMVNSIAS